MNFSLRTLLIAMALLVILIAVMWPYLADRLLTYEVIAGGNSGGGQHAVACSAESLRAAGHPTFIYNRACSDQIPYLNGDNLPYVAVIHHDPDANFNFKSKANIDLTISVLTEFSFDKSAFSIEHKLIRDFYDSPNPPRVTEELMFNGDELNLDNGRLLEITLKNGTYSIAQHKLDDWDFSFFNGSYQNEMERVKPVLKWWHKTKQMIHSSQDAAQ